MTIVNWLGNLDAKQLLILGASVLGEAHALKDPYVLVAEIEIDPAQLEPYKAAVKEQIERPSGWSRSARAVFRDR